MSVNVSVKTDTIGKFVTYSFLGHIALVTLFTVRTFLFPEQNINFSDAIHVDMVALPDKITPADSGPPATEVAAAPPSTLPPVQQVPLTQAPAPPITAVKTIPKPSDPTAIDLSKAKEKLAMQKLKQLSAFDKLKTQIENDQARPAAIAKPLKGNAISPGTALTGLARLEADQYLSAVDRHIRQFWALPEYLRQRGLKAEVLVKFDNQGFVIAKDIVRGSGNSTFDEIVLAAVQKSSPVPRPPEKFVGISTEQGFLFRFSE